MKNLSNVSSIIMNENNDFSQSEIIEDKTLYNNLDDPFEKRFGKYYSDLLTKLEKKGYFFYCENCNNLLLHFDNDSLLSLDEIVYSCNCTGNKKETIPIDELFTKFIKNEKDNKNEIYQHFTCNICLKRFYYYCKDHGVNFCMEKHLNEENSSHKDEKLLRFEEHDIIGFIKYIIFKFDFGNYKFDETDDEETLKFKKFKELIEIILINFILFPNYNIYQNIKNLYDALMNFSIYCVKNNKSNKFNEGIEIINNKNELEELDPDLYRYVININLKQSKAYNTAKFNSFENLEELNLRENCINSIASFLNIKWKNLRALNLSGNKLGDENIEYFENLDLQKLVSLILDQNNFSNYDLLIAIAKNKKGSFTNLEDLRIGFNDFKVGKNIISKKKKKKNSRPRKTLEELIIEFKDLNFNKVKKLYVNNGVFIQKTAEKLLPIIALKNLKILDTSFNHLTNLKFFEKCNWKIKKLHYKGNHLKLDDIFPLKIIFKDLEN